MSWIDVMRDDRWNRDNLEARSQNVLNFEFPDQDKLRRKAHQVSTGSGFMDPIERARWEAFNARQGELERQVDEELATMATLEQAFAVEAAKRVLVDDPENVDALAVVGAAPQVVLDLVALRGRV